MDWPESTEPKLVVFPKGVFQDGGKLGTEQVVTGNAQKWTSKYGSIVVSIYGLGTVDGFNEKGLAMHMLYLKTTDFGKRDPNVPGIQAGLWGQYVLDNAANVKEALDLLEEIQVIMVEAHGRQATVHLALEDAEGDSAIIEYIDGKKVVHHGRQYKIMTNDPTYDEQLKLLAKHDFSKPSREMPLPGNVNAVDRFQRAAYYTALLPKPKNEREAIASVFSVMRNTSVPFGAPYGEFGIYNTEYRTVMNLTGKRYYFELSDRPNVIWADLSRFDLREGAPVMVLDPTDADWSGNVTDSFKKQ